jgi:murein DD-endopeptidase MepM/ murein hydrolase activator NlpD
MVIQLKVLRLWSALLFLVTHAACQSIYRRSQPMPPTTANAPEESTELIAETRMTQPRGNLQPRFDWPIDEARLTRGFIPNKVRGKRRHLGIDLANVKGTPVLASHDGTVIYVGKSFRGYGKMVMLRDSSQWVSIYAHLSTIIVRQGEKVKQGDPIGGMGKTGRAFGTHLHFEIRTLAGPVDPMEHLPHGSILSQN